MSPHICKTYKQMVTKYIDDETKLFLISILIGTMYIHSTDLDGDGKCQDYCK